MDQCHKDKYTEARKSYTIHIDNVNSQEYNEIPNGTVVFSMVLQKVLMLPMLEQFKDAILTKVLLYLKSLLFLWGLNTKNQFHAYGMRDVQAEEKRTL